jgi:hypothetical protein
MISLNPTTGTALLLWCWFKNYSDFFSCSPPVLVLLLLLY